jgi:hypothetical protein
MLKTLLLSALLVASFGPTAKSQDRGPVRPVPMVATGPGSVAHPSPADSLDDLKNRATDAALRFATRRSDTDNPSPSLCTGRRWKCVVAGGVAVGFAGVLLGSALGAEPKYEPRTFLFWTVDQCVAHCDDKARGAQRFGLAGLVIGASASFALTR